MQIHWPPTVRVRAPKSAGDHYLQEEHPEVIGTTVKEWLTDLEIFQEWRAPFASCIAEAQTAAEIDATFDPAELDEFLLPSWEGAILRMKVERGPAALDRFKNIAFQTILGEPE